MQESLTLSLSKKSWLSLYLDLAKARLSALVVITTFVGLLMAIEHSFSLMLIVFTVVGTALSAAGANAFNQWIEIERDLSMYRTQSRPLPTGQLSKQQALIFAFFSSITGVLLLAVMVNQLTAMLALINIILYVCVYTPLKPISTLNTLVGAICGAIPPMMGWTAVTGELGYGAWILASILFVWQIPHFLALAWLYRDDYERGGFKMLPILDRSGRITCQVIVLYCLALICLGIVASTTGVTGWLSLLASTVFGLIFLWQGIRLYFERTETNARALFFGSLLYLPIVLGFMVVDKNLDTRLMVNQSGMNPIYAEEHQFLAANQNQVNLQF